MKAKELIQYYERREAEIIKEANKEWLLAVSIIVYIILVTIFICILVDFAQSVAHYKAITTAPTAATNRPPVFIRP